MAKRQTRDARRIHSVGLAPYAPQKSMAQLSLDAAKLPVVTDNYRQTWEPLRSVDHEGAAARGKRL